MIKLWGKFTGFIKGKGDFIKGMGDFTPALVYA